MQSFSRIGLNAQGIICLIGALFFLTISDSVIKWLSPSYPLHELMLFRGAISLVILLSFIHFTSGLATLRTRRPGLHFLRGLLLVLANMFFFLGLSVMSLAETVVLFYTAPLFICLLARPFLGEEVGFSRWLAIAIGMVGVVVLVQPGGGEYTWNAVLPILAALTYSLMVMMTRILGISDSAGTLTVYIQVAFIVVSTMSGLAIGHGHFDTFDQTALHFLLRAWHWPASADLQLLLLCGAAVSAGGFLICQAYRIAQASAIAPFEYTSLPFAVIVGYLVWGDLLEVRDYLGTALIISGGLLVVYVESRKKSSLVADG